MPHWFRAAVALLTFVSLLGASAACQSATRDPGGRTPEAPTAQRTPSPHAGTKLDAVDQANYAQFLSNDPGVTFELVRATGTRNVLQQHQGILPRQLFMVGRDGTRTEMATVAELGHRIAPITRPEQAAAELLASDADLGVDYNGTTASYIDHGAFYAITLLSETMFGCFTSPRSVFAITFNVDKQSGSYSETDRREIAKDTINVGVCVD